MTGPITMIEPEAPAAGSADPVRGVLAFLESTQRTNSRDINDWRADVDMAAKALRAALDAVPVAWSEADAVVLAHRAGFAGTSWAVGPQELVHLLNLAGAPLVPAARAETKGTAC